MVGVGFLLSPLSVILRPRRLGPRNLRHFFPWRLLYFAFYSLNITQLPAKAKDFVIRISSITRLNTSDSRRRLWISREDSIEMKWR